MSMRGIAGPAAPPKAQSKNDVTDAARHQTSVHLVARAQRAHKVQLVEVEDVPAEPARDRHGGLRGGSRSARLPPPLSCRRQLVGGRRQVASVKMQVQCARQQANISRKMPTHAMSNQPPRSERRCNDRQVHTATNT